MKKLSMSTAQSLLSVVKDEINNLQYTLDYITNFANYLYIHADKSKPETSLIFLQLNETRNEVRFQKKRLKKLANISQELKLSLKE